MSQKSNRLLTKTILLEVENQFRFVQCTKDCLDVFFVLDFCSTVHEYVVQIHHTKLVEERTQNIVHRSLKTRWGIGESLRHNSPFILTVPTGEGCLRNGVLVEGHLPVSILHVERCKVASSLQLHVGVVDTRERIGILGRNVVQSTIIDTNSPRSSRFHSSSPKEHTQRRWLWSLLLLFVLKSGDINLVNDNQSKFKFTLTLKRPEVKLPGKCFSYGSSQKLN